MNLMQTMTNDLNNLYNLNEFGVSAEFNSNPIVVIFLEDIEISSSKEKLISVQTSDVLNIDIGNIISLEGVDYEVINFDNKDEAQLEQLVALERV